MPPTSGPHPSPPTAPRFLDKGSGEFMLLPSGDSKKIVCALRAVTTGTTLAGRSRAGRSRAAHTREAGRRPWSCWQPALPCSSLFCPQAGCLQLEGNPEGPESQQLCPASTPFSSFSFVSR